MVFLQAIYLASTANIAASATPLSEQSRQNNYCSQTNLSPAATHCTYLTYTSLRANGSSKASGEGIYQSCNTRAAIALRCFRLTVFPSSIRRRPHGWRRRTDLPATAAIAVSCIAITVTLSPWQQQWRADNWLDTLIPSKIPLLCSFAASYRCCYWAKPPSLPASEACRLRCAKRVGTSPLAPGGTAKMQLMASASEITAAHFSVSTSSMSGSAFQRTGGHPGAWAKNFRETRTTFLSSLTSASAFGSFAAS